MTFDELMVGFGEKIGVAPMLEDGAASFSIDDMPVAMRHLTDLDAIALMGEIGSPPPEKMEPLLSALLTANHLFAGTGGATISRDAENGKFYLNRLLPMAVLDVDAFIAALEKFVNTLEVWRKTLADYRPLATAKQNAAESVAFGAQNFLKV